MSRPFGTATELERRRRHAVQAVDRGESPELVARTYGINRASIYRWLAMARQPDGLAAKPHRGPQASRLNLYFQVLPDNVHGEEVVAF